MIGEHSGHVKQIQAAIALEDFGHFAREGCLLTITGS